MRLWQLAVCACVSASFDLLADLSVLAQTPVELQRERQRMVDEEIVAGGVKNERVIRAMRETPRHEFVLPADRKRAYLDISLPIGAKQTISGPFVVAYMTEALDPQLGDKVLEIGTGSGYQAAVLSGLVKEVYSIEIVEELGKKADRVLQRLKYENVHTKIGDGYEGWAEHAPFDKIIVTCSPEKVPKPLTEQLREGGLMVVPVGERYQQTLYLFRKQGGELKAEPLRSTLFVPMTGKAESAREVKPDPAHPRIANGGFEQPAEGEPGRVQGWYYERRMTWNDDPKSPEGKHCVTFRNTTPGLTAHILQGLPVDGRAVAELEFSIQVKANNVHVGDDAFEQPTAAITFFDDQRKDVGTIFLGPWRGTFDWKTESKTFAVPPKAREAIVRVGLFGSVGEASFDDVRIRPIPRK